MRTEDLPLSNVVLLDRIQKKLPVTDEAIKMLKQRKLIEGRKPNYFIAAQVATTIDDKVTYIRNRAFDKEYYKAMILGFIKQYKEAARSDIDNLLIDKLSDVLTAEQKRNKIRNLLYEMSKKDGTIFNASSSTANPVWMLSKNADFKIRKNRDLDKN